MILCPIEGITPVITQKFGERPDYYKKYNMKGHNGLDIRATSCTPIFAPFDGYVKVKKDTNGYGLHIFIRSDLGRECVLAHLSEVFVENGTLVKMGNKIALSGNTGDSSAPHLHFGYRQIEWSTNPDLFTWTVRNYNNGYCGAVDISKYVITWEGSLTQKTLTSK